MAYHWTLHIDAPPEKVFDTLADVEHHAEWANEKAKLTLSPEDGGTRLERSTDGDGNPVVGFLAKPAIMKDGRTSLGNLKARVEASA